jgi:hypothetical protein
MQIRIQQNRHKKCEFYEHWYVSRENPNWDESCYEDMSENPQTMFQYLHLDGEWKNSMLPVEDGSTYPYFYTKEEAVALATKYGYRALAHD